MMHGGRAPQVMRAAAERLADLIDPQRLLRESARIAYSDVRQLMDAQGHLLPVRAWSDAAAAAVSSVKVVKHNEVAGDGQQEQAIEVKLWDKLRSLELLFRHLGMLRDRLELSADWDDLAARLASARQRVQVSGPAESPVSGLTSTEAKGQKLLAKGSPAHGLEPAPEDPLTGAEAIDGESMAEPVDPDESE